MAIFAKDHIWLYTMGNKASKDKQKLKPSAMDDLLQSTMFTEEEIKSWYKNFLKVKLCDTLVANSSFS